MIAPEYTGRAIVNLDAIAHNTAELRRRAGNAVVMAVVKADAYGHGLLPSARAALAGGAQWLGVAQLREGLALRRGGVQAPILSWLHAPGVDFAPALCADIDLGVSALWTLDAVDAAARSTGMMARVHLKVDTGLGRNGAAAHAATGGRTDWERLVDRAAQLEAEGVLTVVGVFSHFAYADFPNHPSVRAQLETFRAALAVAERAKLSPEVRHFANSAATLALPDAAWDMVRPGVSVFGLTPAPNLGSSTDFGLIPAMTATATVSLVKRVGTGQGVSYSHTFTTTSPTSLANIPLGYADGVPRHLSNRAKVSIRGEQRPIAGRVCMDQFVVDVGDHPVVAGDEVVLFGPGTGGEPTAQDWADAGDTISYEIVSRFGPRVPRIYAGSAGRCTKTESALDGAEPEFTPVVGAT